MSPSITLTSWLGISPSNNTIHALEEENRRLRELVKQYSTSWSPAPDGPGAQPAQWQSPNPSSPQQQPFALSNVCQGPSPSSELDTLQLKTAQWPKTTFSLPLDLDNSLPAFDLGPLSYADTSPENISSSPGRMEAADAQETESRLQISSTGHSSYHGPTSTLFETNISMKSTNGFSNGVPTEWLRSTLVATTSRQRAYNNTISFAD